MIILDEELEAMRDIAGANYDAMRRVRATIHCRKSARGKSAEHWRAASKANARRKRGIRRCGHGG